MSLNLYANKNMFKSSILLPLDLTHQIFVFPSRFDALIRRIPCSVILEQINDKVIGVSLNRMETRSF